MRSIKHVVIAAAGMGTRMGQNQPKCLIDFYGKPLIHHLLENLKDFEDVRIVVGYKAGEVIEMARKVRKDLIFVFNNSYKSTTTLQSYLLASHYLNAEGVVYMDADIFFQPRSISKFFDQAESNLRSPLIGVTKVKTEDCVYAELNEHKQLLSFSRFNLQPWEWANIAYLPKDYLNHNEHKAVYQELEPLLPLPAFIIDSYEMDTSIDKENALKLLASENHIGNVELI